MNPYQLVRGATGRVALTVARPVFSSVYRIISLPPLKQTVTPNFRATVASWAYRKVMDSPTDLEQFWNQEKPVGNYFDPRQSSPRSQTLIAMLHHRICPDATILEVGCNVGRNLSHLYLRGYTRLAGIEISEAAVRRLREHLTHLSLIPIDVGPAEEILGRYPTGAFDVVFTMAVLEHIHPSSRHIFQEIARVAGHYVLAIEPRSGHVSHRQYPWNIEAEYVAAGLMLIDKKSWSSLWDTDLTLENHWHPGCNSYDALLFQVPDQK